MIFIFQFYGIIEGDRIPGCKAPIGLIITLIFLKSVNILHFPDFFLITKTGEFKGQVAEAIWLRDNCSFTNCSRAFNFSCDRGHCSVQIGSSDFHVNLSAILCHSAVVPAKKPVYFEQDYIPYLQ